MVQAPVAFLSFCFFSIFLPSVLLLELTSPLCDGAGAYCILFSSFLLCFSVFLAHFETTSISRLGAGACCNASPSGGRGGTSSTGSGESSKCACVCVGDCVLCVCVRGGVHLS